MKETETQMIDIRSDVASNPTKNVTFFYYYIKNFVTFIGRFLATHAFFILQTAKTAKGGARCNARPL